MCGICYPRVFIHHSPNGVFLGSMRDKAVRGGAMRGDGTKAGFPDLLCLWSPGTGCMMEVKRPKAGRLNDNQKAVHGRLAEIRWPVAVVTSVEEAYQFLFEQGAPRDRELRP
jgi:hypothetical protein